MRGEAGCSSIKAPVAGCTRIGGNRGLTRLRLLREGCCGSTPTAATVGRTSAIAKAATNDDINMNIKIRTPNFRLVASPCPSSSSPRSSPFALKRASSRASQRGITTPCDVAMRNMIYSPHPLDSKLEYRFSLSFFDSFPLTHSRKCVRVASSSSSYMIDTNTPSQLLPRTLLSLSRASSHKPTAETRPRVGDFEGLSELAGLSVALGFGLSFASKFAASRFSQRETIVAGFSSSMPASLLSAPVLRSCVYVRA